MATNFPTQAKPVQVSQYQPKGLDYWLYGPQLKAKARGLGMQIAGSMRNDITGIHQNDMPEIQTLTGRIGRKRDEYIDKIMDGADVNDQFVKSLSQTFRENKSIQGSILEAKKNNQKIEAYKQMALEKGVESGDMQYYTQWVNDSIKDWGSTFKGGQVNPFELKVVPDYKNIIQDFEGVMASVEKKMTPEQRESKGVSWNWVPQQFKDPATGKVIGTKMMLQTSTPGLFHSNKKEIDTELEDFYNRFDTSKDPEKRGQYADFLEFRTREDGSYLPNIKKQMEGIARRSTWEYQDPAKPGLQQGNFFAVPKEETKTQSPFREGYDQTNSIVHQSNQLPRRPLERKGGLSSGLKWIQKVRETEDGTLVADYTDTRKDSGDATVQDRANEHNTVLKSMIGEINTDDLLKSITAPSYSGSNPYIDWLNRVYKGGDADAKDTKAVKDFVRDITNKGIKDFHVNDQDVLADFGINPDKDPVNAGGEKITNVSVYSADFYGGYVPEEGNASKLSDTAVEAAKKVEEKVEVYNNLVGLYDKYLTLDPTVDVRSTVTMKNADITNKEFSRIQSNIQQLPYSVFVYDPETRTHKELGSSFQTKKKWDKIDGKDFSNEGIKDLMSAMNNPGTWVNDILVEKKFDVAGKSSDWSGRIDTEVWESQEGPKQEFITQAYKNGDILKIKTRGPQKDATEHHLRVLVGTIDNPNTPFLESNANPSTYYEQVGGKGSGQYEPKAANIFDIVNGDLISGTQGLKEVGDTRSVMLGDSAEYQVTITKIEGGPNAYAFQMRTEDPAIARDIDGTTNTSVDLHEKLSYLASMNYAILQGYPNYK